MALERLNPTMRDAAHRDWLVEKNGRVFARLEDARFAEMFWVSYRVVDLTKNDVDRSALFASDFWHQAPHPTFRNSMTGASCSTAFAGRTPTQADPVVHMRALYSP